MTLDARLTYRLVLANDIAGFSRRTVEQQQRAQTDLCRVLDAAAARAGLDRACWHRQDRGDGELAVLPEGIDMARVVAGLVRGMESALAGLNRGRGDDPLRVRLALHHGTLTDGSLGPVGRAPIMASRLVDVDVGREYLRTHPESDLVVIVSATLYDDVIRTGFCPLDPDDFAAFHDVIKDTPYDGYLYPARPRRGHAHDHLIWRLRTVRFPRTVPFRPRLPSPH